MTVIVKNQGKETYITGQEVPKVSPLFIDMLTMTLSIPHEFHPSVVTGFQKAYDVGWGKKFPKTAYSHNLKLTADFPHDEGNVLIQCSPKILTHNFFRIDVVIVEDLTLHQMGIGEQFLQRGVLKGASLQLDDFAMQGIELAEDPF